MTGAVDSVAPREQPTTQNQCSCRFKQRKKQKTGWVTERGWRGCEKNGGTNPKNGREKRRNIGS